MTRVPLQQLRVGDLDLLVGYEQRGSVWVVYRTIRGQAPGTADQAEFDNRLEAHAAWKETCHKAIDQVDDSMAAPEQTTGGISHFFDDLGSLLK